MNLSDLRIQNFSRIVAHTVHPKTEESDSYATCSDQCLTFTGQEKGMLIGRLYDALGNSRKTFELNYEYQNEGSLFHFLHRESSLSDSDFVVESARLASELASAHFRKKIPGGYCLFGEGNTFDGQEFFFVIKAELQEVFQIENNSLQLIKDVFLSPAKELHKIGFFIRRPGSNFTPFMYDDQFSPQKKDLTEYFYGKFMGLTTDLNDALRSKNFHQQTKEFISSNIQNVADKIGLLGALNTLYREETSGLIDPKGFVESYFEGGLKNKFELDILPDFPHSFTKDTTLLDRSLNLDRVSIPLTYSVKLVGSVSSLADVSIIEEEEIDDEMLNSIPVINNRRVRKIVVVSSFEEEAAE